MVLLAASALLVQVHGMAMPEMAIPLVEHIAEITLCECAYEYSLLNRMFFRLRQRRDTKATQVTHARD